MITAVVCFAADGMSESSAVWLASNVRVAVLGPVTPSKLEIAFHVPRIQIRSTKHTQ